MILPLHDGEIYKYFRGKGIRNCIYWKTGLVYWHSPVFGVSGSSEEPGMFRISGNLKGTGLKERRGVKEGKEGIETMSMTKTTA